jgi:tRNA (cmo5U34)-methyltransferase
MDAYQFSYQPFDVAVCFLVLMFMPVGDRAVLIDRLRKSLRKGGAIIVFDKVMPSCGYFGTVMRRLTMSWKLNNGAKPEDIVAKELSLCGVQRPLNPSVLGPDAKQFFAFGEFAGYLIENPE